MHGHAITIELPYSSNEVFDRILEVSKWWTRDFEGSSAKLNDEFIIHHPGSHYSKKRLIELIPGKRIVWLVVDSELNWLEKDKAEWTGTKLIFELTGQGSNTVLHFTHEGLIPEKECYARCREGWDIVIKERLSNYIITGQTI